MTTVSTEEDDPDGDADGVTSLIAPSLRGYRPAWARRDVIAGATVWAVLEKTSGDG